MSITYTLFVTFFAISGALAQEAKTYKIRTVPFTIWKTCLIPLTTH